MQRLFICIFFVLLILTSLNGQEKTEVIIDENLVTIKNISISANCCSSFHNELNINNNIITITQRDTTINKCKCSCNFDLSYSISQIPPGNYTLIINRDELQKFGYPENKKLSIYKTKFSIESNNSKSPLSFDFKQSPCKKNSELFNNDYPKNGIEVFPNPASSFITARFDMKKSGDVTIKILNFLGKEIASIKRYNVAEGIQTISFEMNDVPAGFYVGKLITSTGQNQTFKIAWSK